MTTAERKEKLEYLRKFIKPELGVYTIDIFETIQFFMSELDRRDEALRFYAQSNHFEFDDCIPRSCKEQFSPETVSGEPMNYLCGHGDFTFEDGAVAREALGEK